MYMDTTEKRQNILIECSLLITKMFEFWDVLNYLNEFLV